MTTNAARETQKPDTAPLTESTATAVAQGLVETPFFSRMNALSKTKQWMPWAGKISPTVLDTVEFEYFAIRNQATLFDVSPMHKYRITGRDAEQVVNRLITRDAAKIRPGRVAYTMWCDEDGMVIDDGTVFRFGETDFQLLCQEPQYSWLHDVAWGYDVAIADETDEIAGLSVQGPTSYSVLAAAGIPGADALKPFDHAELEPGLTVSRTGFTGDLGYEIWVDGNRALALWDRLWDAGRSWGLRAIGYAAVDITRLEAGFVVAAVDFHSTHHVLRPTRGRTPLELGFSWMVDFDKGHFNGRRALLEHKKKGVRRTLVKLDIDGWKPAIGALVYHRKKNQIGHVTSAAWSPTAKRNIALAELKAPFGLTKNDDLWTEIYFEKEGKWERTMARARIVERPFFKPERARLTPPAAY